MRHVKLKTLSVFFAGALVLLPDVLSAHSRQRSSRRSAGGRDTQCFPASQPRMCLACNAYYESRGEPFRGQVAVNRVVLTRTERRGFPKSVCGVVYQRHQFSWTSERHRRRKDPGAWNTALKAADSAMQLGSNGSDHFHATYVRPRWARRCANTGRIGRHVFYNCSRETNIARNRRPTRGTAAMASR